MRGCLKFILRLRSKLYQLEIAFDMAHVNAVRWNPRALRRLQVTKAMERGDDSPPGKRLVL
ncbi:hypothetical protein ADM96_26435 [Burkholderia sp. ST111]|nr:hypothetical protein ADM96_26435 [Burkholderia sp. ST111]